MVRRIISIAGAAIASIALFGCSNDGSVNFTQSDAITSASSYYGGGTGTQSKRTERIAVVKGRGNYLHCFVRAAYTASTSPNNVILHKKQTRLDTPDKTSWPQAWEWRESITSWVPCMKIAAGYHNAFGEEGAMVFAIDSSTGQIKYRQEGASGWSDWTTINTVALKAPIYVGNLYRNKAISVFALDRSTNVIREYTKTGAGNTWTNNFTGTLAHTNFAVWQASFSNNIDRYDWLFATTSTNKLYFYYRSGTSWGCTYISNKTFASTGDVKATAGTFFGQSTSGIYQLDVSSQPVRITSDCPVHYEIVTALDGYATWLMYTYNGVNKLWYRANPFAGKWTQVSASIPYKNNQTFPAIDNSFAAYRWPGNNQVMFFGSFCNKFSGNYAFMFDVWEIYDSWQKWQNLGGQYDY